MSKLIAFLVLYILLETSKKGEPARGGLALPVSMAAAVIAVSIAYIRNPKYACFAL